MRLTSQCSGSTQSFNIYDRNGTTVMFYHDDGPFGIVDYGGFLAANFVLLPAEHGKAIIDLVKSGADVTADFSPLDKIVGLYNNLGGAVQASSLPGARWMGSISSQRSWARPIRP